MLARQLTQLSLGADNKDYQKSFENYSQIKTHKIQSLGTFAIKSRSNG